MGEAESEVLPRSGIRVVPTGLPIPTFLFQRPERGYGRGFRRRFVANAEYCNRDYH